MRSPRARSVLCSLALSLVPVVVLLTSPASFAAKPAAKAAAKPATKTKAASKASTKEKPGTSATPKPGMEASKPSTDYKYEVPSPAGPPIPDPPPPSAVAETLAASPPDKPAAPAAAAEKEPAKDVPPNVVVEKSALPDQPEPAPPAVEEPPAPVEPPPVYVEHLGPSAYPGQLRGIYGGSMWLEPSFNGLQWPYMKKSGVGGSGSIWVDSGYEKISRGPANSPNTTMLLQQARAVLRVTPTYTDGKFFIQGQVELVGNQCQTTSPTCTTVGTFDTDDLWIRFGSWNKWDLKVGRFEGWEIYHTGMGLDINTLERLGAKNYGVNSPDTNIDAPDFYGVNYLHDRPSAGMGVGYVAFHGYLSQALRVELLGELGTENVSSTTGHNYWGGRPAAILDLGWIRFKAGAEYEKATVGTQETIGGVKVDYPYKRTRKGFGGSVQFVFDPHVEFGGNMAHGSVFETDLISGSGLGTGSYDTTSLGGFLNARLSSLWMFGGGVNFTYRYDSFYNNGSPNPDYTGHLQAFGAIQYLMARQLFVKVVLGYARADFQTSDQSIPIYSNYMYSGRVRLMYLY
jgi:hypothetical protein